MSEAEKLLCEVILEMEREFWGESAPEGCGIGYFMKKDDGASESVTVEAVKQ